VRRTQDVEKSWSCDRCLHRFPLTLAQRRFIAGNGPDVALPLRGFQFRSRPNLLENFQLCADCALIADPDDPMNHLAVRASSDLRSLASGAHRSLTEEAPGLQSVVSLVPVAVAVGATKPVLELGPVERAYAAQARSANTLKGYRSDWMEWTSWCEQHGIEPMPAEPVAVAKYLASLAGHGAKVGTMSRRLSSIRFVENAAGVTSQLDDSIVTTVWEGIRRTHSSPPDRSAPIKPPLLWRMLEATPTRKANGEPVMAGLRDHVLLLVGFVGALRRGELAGIDVEHLEPHEKGLTLHIPSSKTNQTGSEDELVILPASPTPGRCPVAAIRAWRTATGIDNGPLLRGLTKSQKPRSTRMDNSSINMLVKQAVARCGEDPIEYSAHGLRAGFVTYANLLGQPDRSIARQTRHKSLASLGQYVRISDAWTNNAAVELHI
jgi:integrase